MASGAVPIKTPEGHAELGTRRLRLSQRHRTVLFLVDGRRSEAQVKALADSAVKFAYDNKAIDDTAYAEIGTRSGMRSGKSKRAIAQKLSQKGVAKATVAAAVAEADDFYAALVLARKRAFGPFRKCELDEKRQTKELSAFARAGFSFELGKRIFSMQREEAEEALDERRHL